MSTDKSYDENTLPLEELTVTNKSQKDLFFEMEEYRDDIYNYLREHEV